MPKPSHKEWTIFHNPRCSKSREALALLEAEGIKPTIVDYLKDSPTSGELLALMEKLGKETAQMVRTKEEAFEKAPFNLSDRNAIADHLAKSPGLLERPIVVRGDRAIVARPPERVKDLF